MQFCSDCHRSDGAGVKGLFPPLAGNPRLADLLAAPNADQVIRGRARTYTAAAFFKRNMPIGFHEKFPLGQGGLSDQEAVDVAAYFSGQPRPDFPDKVKDWPNGGKPVDAHY